MNSAAHRALRTIEPLEARQLLTVNWYDSIGYLELIGTSSSDYFALTMISATEFEVRTSPMIAMGRGARFTGTLLNVFTSLDASSDTLLVQDMAGAPKFAAPMLVICDSYGAIASGGNDRVTTGAGNDTVYGHGGGDVISTGDGDDIVYGFDVVGSYSSSTPYQDPDSIDAGAGYDAVYGGPDKDTIWGGSETDDLHGDESADEIHGDSSVAGSTGDDFIYGGADSDRLDPGDGDDEVHGEDGNDTVLGSSGHDDIWGDAGNDNIWGGADTDMILAGSGDDYVVAGDGDDQVSASSGGDTIHGGNGNDVIACGTDNDTVYAGDGDNRVDGESGNDVLHGEADRDTMFGGAGKDSLYGSDGDDELHGDDNDDYLSGGNHADQLFAGSGTDRLDGGSGDDILVAIDDDDVDDVLGLDGFDSFWIDRTGSGLGASTDNTDADAEEQDTNLHKVEAFENGADLSLNGDAIADPTDRAHYVDFGAGPLFASVGPTMSDVDQGELGDCWLLASLAAGAMTNPNVLRQTIADLGDGTFVVELDKKQYRVDAELPVENSTATTPMYAALGAENSLWVGLIEKAYALHKGGTYSSISGDSPYEALGKLDGRNRTRWNVLGNAEAVLEGVRNQMLAGFAATVCTKNSLGASDPLVGDHAYAVVNVLVDSAGNAVEVELFNPWAVDGRGDDGSEAGSNDGANDGFLTITVAEFERCAADWGGAITADFSRFDA